MAVLSSDVQCLGGSNYLQTVDTVHFALPFDAHYRGH